MPYTGGDNLSGYQVRFGYLSRREDGDGRVHMFARALGGATVAVPKVLYFNASNSIGAGGAGYFATVPFTTTKTSATAGAGAEYFVGIPNDVVASNTDAWFQIGGPYKSAVLPSCTFVINGKIYWSGATFTGSAAWASADSFVGCFAVSLSSVSGATNDIFLMGQPVCGITI
jgi:hypothetical protein